MWTDVLSKEAPWAAFDADTGKVEVEPGEVYPYILGKMEEMKPELKGIKENPTQNALECARKIFTRYLKNLMYDIDGDGELNIRILRDPKYKLANYPEGDKIDTRPFYIKMGMDEDLAKRAQKNIIKLDGS